MSSSINWTGNKVLDPSGSRRASQPAMAAIPTQGSAFMPSMPTQPGGTFTPSMPSQPGGTFTPSMPTQPGGTFTPSMPTQPGGTFTPSMPTQPGGTFTPSMPTQPGGTFTPSMPMQPSTPEIPETRQGPPPSSERGYIPYYLASNIGKNVRAEFIVGSDQYVDKTGVLSEVGINYFVLHDVNSRTDIMCDLYSVKFVTILQI